MKNIFELEPDRVMVVPKSGSVVSDQENTRSRYFYIWYDAFYIREKNPFVKKSTVWILIISIFIYKVRIQTSYSFHSGSHTTDNRVCDSKKSFLIRSILLMNEQTNCSRSVSHFLHSIIHSVFFCVFYSAKCRANKTSFA
jgi:hypothetical protein